MSAWACSSPNEDFEDVNPLLDNIGSVYTPTDNIFVGQDDEATEKTPDPSPDSALHGTVEKVTLKRTLGLPGAVGIGLGIIVGSGIFISPEGVAENCGSVGLAMIIWVACGIFSTIGALCFAELGITIPQSGGDYIYILQIFGSLSAFMRLWIEVIVIRPSAHAIIALTMAFYTLQPLFPAGQQPPSTAVKLLGITCVGFLTWINCTSIKWATRMQTLFTAAKVAALLLIVVIGAVQIYNGHVENFRPDVLFRGSNLDAGKICMALYSGLWAFSGWNELNYIVDEIKNPDRYLPISIILSISTATVLYVAVNIAYFTVLTTDQMVANEATAVLFGRITLGKYSVVIPLCVALSCFGGINGSLFTGSRLFYIGACQGHLPPILAMISTRSTAPVPTISFISILTVIYMATDDVFALINYSNFVYFFAMGFAILGLIIIRLKNPSAKKSFQMPLVFPIIAVLVCLVTGFLSFLQAPTESGIGVAVVLTSMPVYLLVVVLEKPRFLTALFVYNIGYPRRTLRKAKG